MIIYKTTNIVNGKIYIGKDVDNDPKYLGSGKILKNAIIKYGISNFIKEIIEDNIDTLSLLDDREIYWIEFYNSTNRRIGYNITKGGTGGDVISNNPNRGDIIKKLGFKKGSIPWNKGLKEFMKGPENGNYGNPTNFRGNNTTFKPGKDHIYYGKKQTEETIKKRIETFKKNNSHLVMSERQKKPVLQFNLNGEFIKEWPSLKEVGEVFNIGPISHVVRGKSKTGITQGYKWKYKTNKK